MSTETNPNDNLTPEQLFTKMSRSIREQDFETLDSLVATEQPMAQEVEPEPAPVEVEVEEPVEVETPAEEAAVEVQPAEEAGKETPQEQPAAPAVELSKEVQEELQRLRLLEQRVKSEVGRVPALQRKLVELEKKLQKEQPRDAAGSDGDKPIDSKELENALAQIGEVDPVTARALQLLRQEALGSIKKTQSVLEQKEEETLLQREWTKLTEKVPQAAEVFQLPEWESWKEEQSPGILQLAQSSFAEDVLLAMDKFARDMQARHGLAPTNTSVKKEEPQVTPEVNEAQAKIEESRARRLHAVTPKGNAAAPKVKEVLTDAEAIFAQAYKEIVKKDHLDKRR